jgi:Zn-dependent protease with chaperone function
MVIVDIIKTVLGFLGIIATVIILFAGFKWMTSGGNEENVTSAKKMLIAGVIGLVIILFSYALATFILKYLSAAATGTQVIW